MSPTSASFLLNAGKEIRTLIMQLLRLPRLPIASSLLKLLGQPTTHPRLTSRHLFPGGNFLVIRYFIVLQFRQLTKITTPEIALLGIGHALL